MATPKSSSIDRLGPVGREHRDVVGQPQVAGHPVLGVVVAADQEDRDAGVAEPGHLLAEEEPGVVVVPVAVVEVADDQDERDLLLDRQPDEVLQRPPGRPPALLDRRPLVAVEPPLRAVEVDVGGVEELEHRGRAATRLIG